MRKRHDWRLVLSNSRPRWICHGCGSRKTTGTGPRGGVYYIYRPAHIDIFDVRAGECPATKEEGR